MWPLHLTLLGGVVYIIAALRKAGIHLDFHIWTNGKQKDKKEGD